MPQETSTDYGYDLVHEEVARPSVRGGDHRPEDRGATTGAVPRPAAEPPGDYGYDEAHAF